MCHGSGAISVSCFFLIGCGVAEIYGYGSCSASAPTLANSAICGFGTARCAERRRSSVVENSERDRTILERRLARWWMLVFSGTKSGKAWSNWSFRDESQPSGRQPDVTSAEISTFKVGENNIYICVSGEKSPSEPWICVTRFALLNKNSPKGFMWVQGSLTKKQKTRKHLAKRLVQYVRGSPRGAMCKCAGEGPKLAVAGRRRSVYYADPNQSERFREVLE